MFLLTVNEHTKYLCINFEAEFTHNQLMWVYALDVEDSLKSGTNE